MAKIRGIMINGTWTDNPKAVKQEFFQHFRNRFDKPPDQNAHIDMPFPNSLSTDQQKDLECMVSKEEVKRAVLQFILNEIMQWCRRRKKQSLIFKVDFEKAYDSVRWDFLDDILVKFGFGIKWRGWIQNCLNSSKGSILVNGSPTEEFQFYKGLKQGDPLSPFLFILVMESLHISFQRVVDVGMFTGIKLSSSLNISHLFYADDAIFLGQWNDSNIDTLVHVMECFYRVSGLRINLCKSKIMGIHVDADRIKSATSKLGCLVLNTPFLYLGTKVGENMSRVHAWKEVIVKIKSCLSNWKLKTLSIGGRFTLLKSVLGSTPIFHMSIYKVPSSVLHLLESIRSHFFHGHDPRSKKASWVNWNKVLTAKERGGLGVSSLYALNRGLMCKWVWRFFAHKSLLWSRVIKAIHGPEGGLITDVRRGFRSTWTSIVQEVKKLQNQGVNIFDYIRIKIGNGDNTSFWKDKWHNEGVLKDVFPRLYALERHQNVTIHTKLIDYSLVNSFRRNPRSGVEEFQLDNLSRLVSTITLSSAVDRYVWSLENSGEFSVKSIRQVIDANCFPVIHSATRWVKSVPLKVNIMAWKIKMDGLPTRMNISRRGIEIDSIVCPICNSGAESSCHIFFQCNLVRQLARKISSWWNVDYVDVSSYEEWYTWLVSLRLQANLKAVFEGIFYCLWWSVWMFRNKILFEKDTPSQARIFDNIVSNSYYWLYKGEVTSADGCEIIAVKRFDRMSNQRETKRMTDIEYPSISKGSLDRWLKHDGLTWRKRLEICIDITRGLVFLHGTSGAKQEVVIHGDIKSTNVLLHGDWKAKIAYFGCSLISPMNSELKYVVNNAKGTPGYCDPLYKTTRVLTKESDIYSFGVLLLEMLYGRLVMEHDISNRAQNLVRMCRYEFLLGNVYEIMFQAVRKQGDYRSLTTFQDIAYKCVSECIAERPTASDVLIQLIKALEFQWFSLGTDGRRVEVISAAEFHFKSYFGPDKWIPTPES
ncbi:RNA-directed DNA polymerase, eukaryota, reverse transcriptase zinc-binding domain protein, partial [Tanacetum coccineum]